MSSAALPRPDVALLVDIDATVPKVIHTDQGLLRQALMDNDVNRKLLSIMLEQLGNSLFAVADGEAAIAACETTAFDAILMDLNLPRIGGIEATRSILNDPTARHISTPPSSR